MIEATKITLKILALLYFSAVAAMYIRQRSFIYFPSTVKPVKPDNVEEAKVVTSDGLDLYGWYIPPKSGKNMPVIVFFHGNAGNLEGRVAHVREYINAGYGVLLCEYRGYGGNPGKISEQGLYADGHAFIKWLHDKKNIDYRQMVIYGESIGSGIAVEMATHYLVSGLVLEAPFSSLVDTASYHYPLIPVRFLLKDKYLNFKKIGKIHAPLIILHGKLDGIVPFALSQKLFNAASEPKKFIEFPTGSHNNLIDLGLSSYVLDFLAGIHSNSADNIDYKGK